MNLRNRLSSAIDRTIEIVAPRKALERKAARAASEQFGETYKGAGTTRLNSNWQVSSGSADYDLLPDLPILRERSRELLRNDPYAASVVRTMVDNITGTGIRPQANINAEALGISEDQANTIRKACEHAWNKWTDHADVSRRMNFYDMQAQVMRSIIVNGEAFVMPVRIERVVSPYDLCLEMIEPDRIEAPNEMDQINGRFKRLSGVELGKYGYPAAYWVRISHPGDGIYERNNDNRHRRIRANNEEGQPQFLHLMHNTRPGQTRGEPMLAPSLATFHAISKFSEAVLTKERVAACYSLFIQKDDPYNSAINRSDETVRTQRIEEISPGLVHYLSPGESVSTGTPPANNATDYNQYVTRHLRAIGASLGLPIELVEMNFSMVNYSSARASLLEARRVFTRWQKYLISHFCEHVYAMVIEEAWLRGEIPYSGDFNPARYELTRSTWISPSYGWVDPLKEVKASETAINAGLSSLATEAAAQGRDWEELLEQRAREQAYAEELGLTGQDLPLKKEEEE